MGWRIVASEGVGVFEADWLAAAAYFWRACEPGRASGVAGRGGMESSARVQPTANMRAGGGIGGYACCAAPPELGRRRRGSGRAVLRLSSPPPI